MKKVISIALLLTMSIASFTGCGTNKTATSSSAADASKTPEPSKTTVTIFHHIGEQSARDVLKKQIDAVSSKNPGLVFEEQVIDFNQFSTMLKTKIAGGDAPDIVMGRPKMYKELITAGHFSDLSNEKFLENIFPSALDSMKIDGKVYGIPSNYEGMGIFYNKDVFAKNLIAIPTTHAELVAAANKLVANGVTPFAHGFKEGWTAQCDMQGDFYGSPLAKNPLIFKEIMSGAKKFADYPDFKNSIQRYKDRLGYSSGDDFGTDAIGARTMLVKGNAAMLLQGTWEIREITNLDKNAKIGFFTTPNSDVAGESLLGLGSSGSFMLSSQVKNKEAALKFLEFRITPEGAAIDNVDGTVITCVKNVATDKLNPITSDIMKIIEANKISNYEAEDIFTGQFDATFRKWQEEFAADPKRDVDTYINKLDKELAAIQ